MSERILKPNRRHLHALPSLDDGHRDYKPAQRRSRRAKAWGRRRCAHTGKVRLPDHEAAVDALFGARVVRGRATADGVPTARREVRSYGCNACRGWHLTSWATASGPEGPLPIAA